MYLLSIANLLDETFETLEAAVDRYEGLRGQAHLTHRFTAEHPSELDENGERIYVDAVAIYETEEEAENCEGVYTDAQIYFV